MNKQYRLLAALAFFVGLLLTLGQGFSGPLSLVTGSPEAEIEQLLVGILFFFITLLIAKIFKIEIIHGYVERALKVSVPVLIGDIFSVMVIFIGSCLILSIVFKFRLRRCQQTSGRQILHRLSGSPILSSGSLNGPREHGHRRFHIGKVEGATRFAGLLHGRLYSLSCIGQDGPREQLRRNVRPSAVADNTGKNYAKHEPTAKLTGMSYLDQLGLWYSLAQCLSSHHSLRRHSSSQCQLQVACSCSDDPR